MDIAIGIVIGVLLVGGLVWGFLQPAPETTMGKENRARREARRAQKKRAAGESADHSGNQG
jgi:hypothetical protein